MRRTPIKKKSSNPRKILVGKLDRAFSIFIRQRDSVNGRNTCFTCGVIKPIKELDAGHYQLRDYMATRFDEKNVQPQCRYCNRFRSGEQSIFGMELDKKYGAGTTLHLIEKAHAGKKYSIDELEELLIYYKG